MEIFSILWPNEVVLRFIIIGLIICVFVAIGYCFRLRSRIKHNLEAISRLDNKQSIAILENSLKMNRNDHFKTFNIFEENNLKDNSNEPIFEHLRAIYDAGLKSSRLDADLLVKNTIDKICKEVDTIKSLISVFLVIGILGTLVGLALSIGAFNGDSFIVNAQTSNTAQELSKLFGNLKGAFAPSMWGVFSTIVFVIAYTLLIQEEINNLTDLLTITTIKLWLPTLYPTDFQKGENTMLQLKDTIQNADQINTGANELINNLSEANSTVISINKVAEAINNSVEKFDKGSESIGQLEESVNNLYKMIDKNNVQYKTFITHMIESSDELRNKSHNAFLEEAKVIKENFNLQKGQLEKVINTLAVYDKKMFQENTLLNENITNSIAEHSKSMQDAQLLIKELKERNKEVIKNISEPLNEQLATMSEQLRQELQDMTNQIKDTQKALNRINNPLEIAGEKIGKMLKNMIDDNQAIMSKFYSKEGVLDKEQIDLLMKNNRTSVSLDSGNLEQILIEIRDNIKNEKREVKLVKDNILTKWMPLFIGVLLIISIIAQFMIVNQLGHVQENLSQSVAQQGIESDH